MLHAGAKPTGAATSDKRTALHHAAARGWLEITKMLLAAGADRGARDSQERTPLDLAVRYGNRRVADALRGASAAPSASSPARPATLGQAPKTVKDITCVAGFKPEGKVGYVFMAPRETKALGGLDITTTMANDEGVGFFVKVDGVTIFHSGDHNARAGDESFKPEIDFLAGRGLRAGLLFMPISVTGDQTMNQGVHYAMKQLSAVAAFPGHVAAREDVFVEFARDAAKAGITTPIHCPDYGGDHFTVDGRLRAPGKSLRE